MKRLVYLLLFAFPIVLRAQSGTDGPALPSVIIPNSGIYDFTSQINGEHYKLFIIRPKSYDSPANASKRYPVFYLLDGNDTALIAYLTRSRQHSDVPEPIFVGVGYPEPFAGPPVPLPGKPAVAPAQRSADYITATTIEPWGPPANRGAPVFLKVLKEEVIPFVDQHFRTDPTDRALGGHSAGGSFTTYALFQASQTFSKFWIGSPNLTWDNFARFRDESAFAASHKDLNARVIGEVGGQESAFSNREPMFRLQHQVEARHYPHLSWKTIVLPNEDHGTLPLAGMAQALDFLYGPPYIPPTPASRRAIAGNWRLPDGTNIHLSYEGDLLFATGLPFLSNTDPRKQQLITPLAPNRYSLRTMLYLDLEQDHLVIRKMRSSDTITAMRVKPNPPKS